MLKPLKNQLGFSMVQVLMGFALMGAFAVGMISMFQNQNKIARAETGKSEIQMMANVMSDLLRIQNNCAATIRNVSPTPPNMAGEINLTKIIKSELMPNGSYQFKDFYEVGKTYGGIIKIVSLKVRPYQPQDYTPGHKFIAHFQITGDVAGGKDINKQMEFSFESTPTAALPGYPFSCTVKSSGSVIPRCRVCVQLGDGGCGSNGPANCSPWASQPNVQYWTNWTTDSDGYDPDCTRVALECQ